MKRIIIAALAAATTTALAVALPTLAAGGSTNPLGVKIACNATAYPYADDIQAWTITTDTRPIYNVRILNVGWPGGGQAYTGSVGDVPAHSTVSVTPSMGAWYVDPYSTVLGACLSNGNRSEMWRFRGYQNVSEGPRRAAEGLTERHVSPSTITDPRS
jgi:hypothetical protein